MYLDWLNLVLDKLNLFHFITFIYYACLIFGCIVKACFDIALGCPHYNMVIYC